MQIRLVDYQEPWESFVHAYQPNSLLQSWAWGEFAQKQGRRIWRVGLYMEEQLLGVALVIKVTSRRANYLETHFGPLLNYGEPGQFRVFHQYLIELGQQEKVDFVRIRPPLEYQPKQLPFFQRLGYWIAPMYFQAEYTLRLDLRQSEEKLLANLRKNTRYYLRRAGRAGVQVRVSPNPADLKILFQLYQATVQRQRFVPYTQDYFDNEFDVFQPSHGVDLVIGEYQGQPVSAAMIVYYGQTAYYHHGASIHLQPDVFASYLVQWEAICQAQKRGMQTYDFWGVAPTDDPNHPRAGLTLFKRGFGGERVRWMPTLDYPLSWKYWLTYAYVKFERWQRRL